MKKVRILEEITPENLRCSYGACACVFRLSDGDVLVVGTDIEEHLRQEISERIGPGESAVRLSAAFFEKLRAEN